MSIRNLESKHYFTRRSHNFITDINMFCHGVQEILSYFLGNWRDCWCFHLACNHVTSQKMSLSASLTVSVCVCGGGGVGRGCLYLGHCPCVCLCGGRWMVIVWHAVYTIGITYKLPSHVPMLRCCTIRNCCMCFIFKL